MSLFLCGDVMTGRGIDQILPHSVDPILYEGFVKSARGYVDLAERKNGSIPEEVDFEYVWGDALAELSHFGPHARVINLETSVTTHDEPAAKGINYRMHPDNVPLLTTAEIDCCVLGNNHVLDWGTAGLEETLDVLGTAGLATAGAGRDRDQARSPAVLERGGRRIVIFSFATESSGVPRDWAATPDRAGVFYLPEASRSTAREIAPSIREHRRDGDIVIASIHWGGNWGYDVPTEHTEFAHTLIDEAKVNAVHGHSSHHAKAIEIYGGAPIFYGCGDFLNDYEGISGHERFRDDLPLMYFASFAPETGELTDLVMTPLRIRRFRLERASKEEARWLEKTLDRECRPFGARVRPSDTGRLELEW